MATRVKEPAPAPAVAHESPLISHDKLRLLYATMLKCRTLEERVHALFKQSKFSSNDGAAIGEEAAAVGTAIDLRPDDTIGSSPHDFITAFIKGAPLDKIFCHLFARANSPGKGRSSPAHFGYAPLNVITPSSTIAAQWKISAGVALANKMKKSGSIVVAYSGDGCTSLDLLHEALNFAGAHNLPIIFVCQNNLGADPANPRSQAMVPDIGVKAQSYGFPGITVDGNDVVAVYRVAQEAFARARRGHGPTLIECQTYRWYGHSETGPGKHRNPQEMERWKAKDPIAGMEKHLAGKGLFTPPWKQELLEAFNKELDAAIEIAEKSPLPEGVEALDHVFSFDIRERSLNRKVYVPKYES